MRMKIKSIIWSMAVALFVIAMGNCFAREVKYPVKLPNGYAVHFKSWGGTLEKAGMKPINLPNEPYWMTKSDNDLICFMDDCDNVYVGQRYWTPLIRPGLKLYKIYVFTGHLELIADSGKLIDGFGWERGAKELEIYLLWNTVTPDFFGVQVFCSFIVPVLTPLLMQESMATECPWKQLEATRLSDGRYHINFLGERQKK